MNILPKILYPLQMLPDSIPNVTFRSIDKIFTQFLWQGQKVRMKISKLQHMKEQGGLGGPKCTFLAHWAAQLRYMYK